MRNLIFAAMLLGCSPATTNIDSKPIEIVQEVGEINWRPLNQSALFESQRSKKIAIINFSAAGCEPCRRMKATTFQDPHVILMLNNKFIPIMADGDKNLKMLEDLELPTVWPTTLILLPNGHVLTSIQGYIDPTKYLKILKILYTAYEQ